MLLWSSIFRMIAKLEVEFLELCCLYLDLVYAYKILFGMIDTDVSALFVVNKPDNGTRLQTICRLFIH